MVDAVVDEATGRVIIPRKDWAFDPAEGSPFLDWGVHQVDALRWLTGSDAVRVYADYRTYGTPPPLDLSAMVQVTLADGVMAPVVDQVYDSVSKAGFLDAFRVELLPEGVHPLDIVREHPTCGRLCGTSRARYLNPRRPETVICVVGAKCVSLFADRLVPIAPTRRHRDRVVSPGTGPCFVPHP